MDLKQYIDKIPDFPKPGVIFYDLAPLLASASAWQYTVNEICKLVEVMKPDLLAGIESRGFLICAAIATKMNLGSILIRKKGKTPGKTVSYTYNLEYGSDTLEVRSDIIKKGQKIVILDDVLATGGTINATAGLLKQVGAEVAGAVCVMELKDLGGRQNTNVVVKNLLTF